jgi:hypothetical protein
MPTALCESATRKTYLANEVAVILRVRIETVLAYIAKRQLRALNVASPQSRGRRPRWRITEEALDAFLASRSTAPAPQPIPRRRRKESAAGVTNYF